MGIFNLVIFAQALRDLYLERLKERMKHCLETTIENIDEVLVDFDEGLYKGEPNVLIQADVREYYLLRSEYDQVLTHDPVEWWTAMRDNLEYDRETESWKPEEAEG